MKKSIHGKEPSETGRRLSLRTETLLACPACSGTEIQEVLHGDDFDNRTGKYRIDACQECGIRFTNPRPIAEDVPLLYADSTSEPLPVGRTLLGRLRKARQSRRVRRLLGDRQRRTVRCADIGTGDGFFAKLVSEEPFCKHMTAVDFIPKPPPLLRELPADARISFQSQTSFLADTDPMDVIFARFVLEHVGNPRTFLNDLARRLRPGGLLVVEVPNWNSIWRRLFGKYYSDLHLPIHTFHLDPALMPALLPGFRVEVRQDIHGIVLRKSLGNVFGGGSARLGLLGMAALAVEIAVDLTVGPPANMTVLATRIDD